MNIGAAMGESSDSTKPYMNMGGEVLGLEKESERREWEEYSSRHIIFIYGIFKNKFLKDV